jgi:hypothetical protein
MRKEKNIDNNYLTFCTNLTDQDHTVNLEDAALVLIRFECPY